MKSLFLWTKGVTSKEEIGRETHWKGSSEVVAEGQLLTRIVKNPIMQICLRLRNNEVMWGSWRCSNDVFAAWCGGRGRAIKGYSYKVLEARGGERKMTGSKIYLLEVLSACGSVHASVAQPDEGYMWRPSALSSVYDEM